MSIDTANQIINEQEDAIADLKHKLLDMEDSRDLAVGKALNMITELRRIECCEDITLAQQIAREAIDSFQGK